MMQNRSGILSKISVYKFALSPETPWVGPDNLREKLKKAIASKDVSALQSVIEEAEKAALPEVGSDLRKARDTLESLGGGRGG